MNRLDNKTILVTAAAQGIGQASCLAMLREGARVIATDISAEHLQALSEIVVADATTNAEQLTCQVLDVTDQSAVDSLAKQHASLDGLFNCAGFVHHGSILDSTEADWDRAFDLNSKAMWRTTRAWLPGMLTRKHGSIINMSSLASSVKGVPVRCVYGASKAAVIGLTKSVAADYVTQGIRCNAICPGTVESPSLEQRLRDLGDYDKARASFIARQPMQRLGTAEEIAALVVYLASNESAYTTGQIHVIDGGWAT